MGAGSAKHGPWGYVAIVGGLRTLCRQLSKFIFIPAAGLIWIGTGPIDSGRT